MLSQKIANLLVSASAVSASLYGQSNLNHTCALDEPVLSCSPKANPLEVDPCCVETFGGLVLTTQFWNTWTGYESEGQLYPPESWTIHGFWPDFCNGSFTQYCDLNRQYDPEPSPNTTNGLPNGTFVPPYTGESVETFLEPFGAYDLIDYMKTYWIARGQPNWWLWAHEFSKHATCFSTFDVPCYGPLYRKHEDLLQYFETTILFDKQLPTYDWLASAGITPSNSTTYSLADMQAVLYKEYGGMPFLGCSGPRFNETAAGANTTDRGFTELSEAWYYSHVYGRPQNGDYVPTNASATFLTNCAKTSGAIHYYERASGSERSSNSTSPYPPSYPPSLN